MKWRNVKVTKKASFRCEKSFYYVKNYLGFSVNDF